MIAKFSTADDLMAHYATVRARLHGPAKRTMIHPAALPPPPPEPEPEPLPPPVIDIPMVMMPAVPVRPEEIRINFEEVVALVCAHLAMSAARSSPSAGHTSWCSTGNVCGLWRTNGVRI